MEKLYGYPNSFNSFNFIRILPSSFLLLGSHLEMRSYFEPLPKLMYILMVYLKTARIELTK